MLGLGQNAAEVVAGEGGQLHPDRQPPLQLGQQIRGFRQMEGARRDEQDMVGLDGPVFRADRRSLDQRQQVTLHALARHVAAPEPALHGARADLVDLVDEDDAVVLGVRDRVLGEPVVVEQPVRLLALERPAGRLDRHAPLLGGAAAEHAFHHLAEIDHLPGRHPRNVELADRQAARRLADRDVDLLLLEFAVPEHPAELGAGVSRRALADEGGDQSLLGRQFRLRLNFLAARVPQHVDADLDQVADDALHVTAYVTDFGELGRFHLQERRLGELGQTPRDLGLAAASRADHENVLGHDLLANRLGQTLATPAVAERDRNGALGVVLADDEAVELGDDLSRRIGRNFHQMVSTMTLLFV